MNETKCIGKDVRRLLKLGDRLGITLPPEYLRAHGLKAGDQVELAYNNIMHLEPINRAEIQRKLGKEEKVKNRDFQETEG